MVYIYARPGSEERAGESRWAHAARGARGMQYVCPQAACACRRRAPAGARPRSACGLTDVSQRLGAVAPRRLATETCYLYTALLNTHLSADTALAYYYSI